MGRKPEAESWLKAEDIKPGLQVGLWTVLDEPEIITSYKDGHRRKFVKCRCQCGSERYLSEYSLRYGKTGSCGCRGKAAKQDALLESRKKKKQFEPYVPMFGELEVVYVNREIELIKSIVKSNVRTYTKFYGKTTPAGRKPKELKEAEQFFLGGRYEELNGLNGQDAFRRVKKEAERKHGKL